jgi:hypothetical protein
MHYRSLCVPLVTKLSRINYLIKHHALEPYWGSGRVDQNILDLGTRWRWVVSFTPGPLYPRGKKSQYPLYRRQGGPQSRSERGGEEKKSQLQPGIELQAARVLTYTRKVSSSNLSRAGFFVVLLILQANARIGPTNRPRLPPLQSFSSSSVSPDDKYLRSHNETLMVEASLFPVPEIEYVSNSKKELQHSVVCVTPLRQLLALQPDLSLWFSLYDCLRPLQANAKIIT